MNNIKEVKKFGTSIILGIFVFTNIVPIQLSAEEGTGNNTVIYPLKQIAKLSCRFQKFSELGDDCKKDLPILHTSDYQKYIKEGDGYNEMTRTYSELWGSSYKYGWDVGNGGHIGTDIATAEGTPVYAIADGKVIIAKNMIGHGNVISIKHTIRGKVVVSDYAHLSKFDVSEGDTVKVGDKIGEVGSTGNSTGNHLHFEIDLENSFYPYYYDYKTCPYTYYEITETGKCFDELAKNTIDPLLFLETGGAVLDKVSIKTVKIEGIKKDNPVNTTNQNNTKPEIIVKKGDFDVNIFGKTVYKDSYIEDIKQVQMLLKKLGKYNGEIDGNYNNIEEIIFSYQVQNGIVKTKQDEGAGRFGPKTRLKFKNDYSSLVLGNSTIETQVIPNQNTNNTEKNIVENTIKIEKIAKEDVLTRQQIEAIEVNNFLKQYNIDLQFEKSGGNVEIGKTSIIKLVVTDKKGKPFQGNMPGSMTFNVDKTKVSVFPKELYYFTDGKRDIKLTGLKTGNTILNIKIGNQVVKSFDTKVYSASTVIYAKGGSIKVDKEVAIGEVKSGFVKFKDENNREMINLKFSGDYKIKGIDGVEICIKKGDIKDLENIYKKRCAKDEFKKEINFSYQDTLGGILVFDYKVLSKKAKIEVLNNYKNTLFETKSLTVVDPKGLNKNYAYKDEIIKLLENKIVDGVNNGSFNQEKGLKQEIALNWIKNALKKMKEGSTDKAFIDKINKSIEVLKKETIDKNKELTRKEFLDKIYSYFILDKKEVAITIKYKDLDESYNKKVNLIFDKKNTWKDEFGKNYYRPDTPISRGEGAFLLSTIINRNRKVFLTLK